MAEEISKNAAEKIIANFIAIFRAERLHRLLSGSLPHGPIPSFSLFSEQADNYINPMTPQTGDTGSKKLDKFPSLTRH
jgi:hypothetical protein